MACLSPPWAFFSSVAMVLICMFIMSLFQHGEVQNND